MEGQLSWEISHIHRYESQNWNVCKHCHVLQSVYIKEMFISQSYLISTQREGTLDTVLLTVYPMDPCI